MSVNADAKKESEVPALIIDETSNIKYEELSKFENSVLRNAYEKAFSITEDIISKNEDLWEKNAKKNSGTDMRNREQIYNIISFTGERGTGKTSAMLSYMEFLKDYYRELAELKEKWRFRGKRDKKSEYMFTGIEYIDASALNNKEDILGSVLSKMLKKWMDEDKRSFGTSGILKKDDYEYKKRQIRLKFSNVYDCLKDLRSEKDILDKDSDMYMETLEKLSLTLNVKQSFQDLVEDFLDIMVYPGSEGAINKSNHFLVISIDDLDMNISNGFMLMEQIRTYLMVPNVIVLLSANYNQLEKICYNHYMTEFKTIEKEPETKEHVSKLSREYLEKMIPSQRQVNFISGRQWEFFDKQKLKVEYQGKSDKEKGYVLEGTLRDIIKKEFKTYFAVNFGEKCLPYLMPDTLREVCSWMNQIFSIHNMEELDKSEQKMEWIEAYEENMCWFWNEEFPKLCKKYLNYAGQTTFEWLDMVEPDRQPEQIKRLLGQNDNRTLFEVLLDAEQGNQAEQRIAFISIIYYTMKLSALINETLKLEKNEIIEKEKNINEIVKYFGEKKGGIWDKWEKRIAGALIQADGEIVTEVYLGRIEFFVGNNSLALQLNNLKENESFSEKDKKTLIAYQYLLLFYSLDIDFDQAIWINKSGSNNEICLSNEFSGIFSLSNFVLNVFEGGSLVKKFLEDLKKMLQNKRDNSQKQNENNATDAKKTKSKSVDEIVEEISIIKDIENVNYPLVPFNNMEYLIHTGKMIEERMAGKGTKPFKDSEISNKIREYFRILESSLEKFDKYHETEMKEQFSKFPLVKYIGEGNKEIMEKMVYSIKTLVARD